jgi:hypothetical protein
MIRGDFNGYWYVYIHSKLKERSNNNYLRLDEAKSFLFEWRVPKELRIVILKELEQLELIEIEKEFIKLNNCKTKIDNINRVYSKVGIKGL